MRKAEVIDLTSDDTAGGPASANYSRPYVTFASCSGIPATVNAPIKGKTLKPALVQRSSVSMLASDFDGNTWLIFRGSNAAPMSSRRTEKAEEVSNPDTQEERGGRLGKNATRVEPKISSFSGPLALR